MTIVRLKHIDRFRDRHGRWRYYYRAGRGKRVALAGAPGSPEFMLAYEQAARGEPVERLRKERGAPGTFDRLVQDYFTSPDYLRLGLATQRAYRGVIERLVVDENIGHRQVREMTREHVQRMLAKRAARPGAANEALKKLRILVRFAIDKGWRSDDPCARVKKFAEGQFHTWTDEEIAAFERRWPLGTLARTAFALLLYTGQRRSDVVHMAWPDIDGGIIHVVQRKTGARLGVPVHPALAEALAHWPHSHKTILVTSFGKAFTGNGFGNFMADRIAEAGLPERCVTHGLRKAAARRLAEAGCSANEIAAITGHATLAEVSRYTKAAEQLKLAEAAIARLRDTKPKSGIPNLPEGFGNNAKKLSSISSPVPEWRPRQDSNLRPSA
ncbi:MAG: tyrosine-type recombinase/integrase [Hyphomicrobiaceae bacterium]